MNLTYFRPKMRENVKKNNTVSIRFVATTSDICLRTSHLMSC